MSRLHKNEYQFEHSPEVLGLNVTGSDLVNYDEKTSFLEAELCKLIGKEDLIASDQIMFTSGGLGAIEYIVPYLVQGNTIHSITPTYSSFESCAKQFKYKFTQIHFDKTCSPFLFEPVSGDVVYICNPNNPTGTKWDPKEIVEFADSHPNVTILVDEVYIDYSTTDSVTKHANSYKNIYIIKSFSKSYGLAGIRLGYLISDANNIQAIKKLYNPHHVTDFARKFGLAVYQSLGYYKKQIILNNQNRTLLCNILDEMDITNIDCDTNFILMYIGPQVDTFIERLTEGDTYVRNMLVYGFPGWIRCTVPRKIKRLSNLIQNNIELIDKNIPLEFMYQDAYRMHKLLKLTTLVSQILNKFNIPYWISDGTLLGYVRDKSILKWDDDVDFSMMESDIYKLTKLEHEFAKVGLLLCKNRFGVYWQIRSQINLSIEEYYKSPQYKEDPNIDIFIYYIKDGKMVNTDDRFQVNKTRKPDALTYMDMMCCDVFPITRGYLNNIPVNIPQYPTLIIKNSIPNYDTTIRVKHRQSFLEYQRK